MPDYIIDFTTTDQKFAQFQMDDNTEVFIAVVPDYDNEAVTVGVSIYDRLLKTSDSVTLNLQGSIAPPIPDPDPDDL